MGTSTQDPGPFAMPEFTDSTTVNDLLTCVRECDRRESLNAYCRYISVEAVFTRCCDQAPSQDRRVFDSVTNTAARLSAVRRVGQRGSENMVAAALALVWRIPLIGHCLRDGIITDWQFKLLVSRTDLLEGTDFAADVDAEIAAELRRNGVWSYSRLKDMADLVIFGYDPDAVRRARQAAQDSRGVWTADKGDGMSELGVIASAEEVILANAAIEALARSTCKRDPRTIDQRRSDAVMCRLQLRPFLCVCESEDCEADVPEQDVSARQAQIVLNVICSSENLEGDPPTDDLPTDGGPTEGGGPTDGGGDGGDLDDTSDRGPTSDGDSDSGGGVAEDADDGDRGGGDDAQLPATDAPKRTPSSCARRAAPLGRRVSRRSGFLDGHGVISAAHVDEIARRSNVVIRRLNKDPEIPLPTYQPGDKYRRSAALDTYVRIRDGYCTFPGCAKRAWRCEVDHVTEFDHTNPEAGGQTCPCNSDLKCVFHHLLKTFGDWVDDIYVDAEGFTHVMYRTPEGVVLESGGYANERLFPELLTIRFADPPRKARPGKARSGGGPGKGPVRRRPRTEDKHARRLYERKKNREERALRQAAGEAAIAKLPQSARVVAEARWSAAAAANHRLGDTPPF